MFVFFTICICTYTYVIYHFAAMFCPNVYYFLYIFSCDMSLVLEISYLILLSKVKIFNDEFKYLIIKQ